MKLQITAEAPFFHHRGALAALGRGCREGKWGGVDSGCGQWSRTGLVIPAYVWVPGSGSREDNCALARRPVNLGARSPGRQSPARPSFRGGQVRVQHFALALEGFRPVARPRKRLPNAEEDQDYHASPRLRSAWRGAVWGV